MFFRGSRYETVAEAIHMDAKGRQIPYKLLRMITSAPAIQTHAVEPLDRLDMIAFRYYDDPEQFWRICDANLALLPDELLKEPGRRLLIPLVQR